MQCPQCNRMLHDRGSYYTCAVRGVKNGCLFKIGKAKFDSILAGMYKPKKGFGKFQTPDERLSELNNYGREEIGDDFEGNTYER